MPSKGTPQLAGGMVRGWPAATSLLAPLGPWFEANRRNLPWRARDLDARHPDPYAVLVSELMLQQTRVATMVPYFARWMRAFPDAAALAAAGEDELHKHWEGLGYYRRARHLQASARAIAAHGWPQDLQALLELPGLGPYTAAAVASIAFQWPEPALDGNALRVLSRLLELADPRAFQERLREWLRPALARFGPSRTTQGVMELGATLCLARNPRCRECPLSARCRARESGQVAAYPQARKRAVPKEVELWLVALRSEETWLLERPAGTGLLAGLWRWPAFEVGLGDRIAAEQVLPYGVGSAGGFDPWVQVYTHRRERIHPCLVRMESPSEAGPGREWVSSERLGSLPMGSRDQRLRAMVCSNQTPKGDPVPIAAILRALQVR